MAKSRRAPEVPGRAKRVLRRTVQAVVTISVIIGPWTPVLLRK
jgi:hypothetical protein